MRRGDRRSDGDGATGSSSRSTSAISYAAAPRGRATASERALTGDERLLRARSAVRAIWRATCWRCSMLGWSSRRARRRACGSARVGAQRLVDLAHRRPSPRARVLFPEIRAAYCPCHRPVGVELNRDIPVFALRGDTNADRSDRAHRLRQRLHPGHRARDRRPARRVRAPSTTINGRDARARRRRARRSCAPSSRTPTFEGVAADVATAEGAEAPVRRRSPTSTSSSTTSASSRRRRCSRSTTTPGSASGTST